ncbi:MAG: ribonuclease PH [Bacillota bacterium]|nr:ribonuclease PH [Bacillota bacterium]
MRHDGRENDHLRPLKITRSYLKFPEGSALIELGDTRVICTATIEDKIPAFLKGMEQGWVSAEYAMLPRSTFVRSSRERSGASGRSMEIQRLIGRSLRAVIDLKALGERTIWIDCDVLQADGGTRTAAISGAFVALAEAIYHLQDSDKIDQFPLYDYLSAVSVGMVNGGILLDLAYIEDAVAEVDMNLVMTADGKLIEIQGSAEDQPFNRIQLDQMIDLASKGVKTITAVQKHVLGSVITGLIDKSRISFSQKNLEE